MRELAGMSLEALRAEVEGWGQPAFRAGQVFEWLYKKGVLDFGKMTNLPESLRARLKEEFRMTGLSVSRTQRSGDGTTKLLLCAGGNFIEAVAIPARERLPRGNPARNAGGRGARAEGAGRLTGCISSQAGCRYACSFCASGKAGFTRNLTPGEMCAEVLFLRECMAGQPLSHIVFMGTGEPLDNYDNVMAAIRFLNSPGAFGIGARRITVSTCGLIPGIRRLAGEGMQIELSVSLHAADDSLRSRIMPVNRRYPLKELMDACREYAAATGRQVTFEYILVRGVNSDLQNADKLIRIVRDMNCKVNLIPLNPVAGEDSQPPDAAQVRSFQDRLESAGVHATVRTPRGRDVDAACGQLRLRYEKT